MAGKNPNAYFVVLQGVNTLTDLGDLTKGSNISVNVKGIQPTFEKYGEDVEHVDKSITASREEWGGFVFNFAPFYVDLNANENDYSDFLKLKNLLKYKYIAILDTDLTRVGIAGTSFWGAFLNGSCVCLEPIELSVTTDYENGREEVSLTMKYRTA